MVIDHAGCLHERVANRGADEFESTAQQVTTHGVGFGGTRRYLSYSPPPIFNWIAANETPDISVEASAFFFDLEKPFRVLDRGGDFQPVSHDTIVAEQSLHVAFAVARDFLLSKSIEGFSVVVTFPQNCVPAQSRLCAFQDKEFEKDSIVVHRNAPFLVMIGDRGFSSRPGTTRHNVEITSDRQLRPKGGPALSTSCKLFEPATDP